MLLENQEMRDMVKDMIPKIGSNNTTITNKYLSFQKIKIQIELGKNTKGDELKTKQNKIDKCMTDIFYKNFEKKTKK